MTTAVNLIKRSLSILGVHSDINPAPVQTQNLALSVLGEMLAEWEEDAVFIGNVSPDNLTTDLLEPIGTTYTICNNLAVRMGPITRVNVSERTSIDALEGYEKLKEKYQAEETPYVPNATLSRLLPVGQGSSRGSFARTFFSGVVDDDETPSS